MKLFMHNINFILLVPSIAQELPTPLYFEVAQPFPNPLYGRNWLWLQIREHLSTMLPTNKGVIIAGMPGSGKTAIILTLVDKSCFGSTNTEKEGKNQSSLKRFKL